MESDSTNRTVPEPPPKAKWYGLETLETISKATAALLVGTYVFGFMTVSLHNASYGFFEVNPLRPKILAAGLLLVFMTLLPAFVANSLYAHTLELNPVQRFSRAIVATFAYYNACFILTFMLGGLLSLPPDATKSPSAYVVGLPHWLVAVFGGCALAGFLVSFYGPRLAWKTFAVYPMRTALFAGLATLVLLSANLLLARKAHPLAITTWLFGVGVVFAILTNNFKDPQKRKEQDPVWLLGLCVILLTTFSNSVYPQFQSPWGGGSPVPVVVYFSRDSRFLPDQQLDADILDESDSGFYIVQRGQARAIFIPRNAVATIYFSDKPLDPALLSDSQKQPTK